MSARHAEVSGIVPRAGEGQHVASMLRYAHAEGLSELMAEYLAYADAVEELGGVELDEREGHDRRNCPATAPRAA